MSVEVRSKEILHAVGTSLFNFAGQINSHEAG
jgi:hypothetical protein